MGLTKKSASTRQPSPAPSVNHRAENPLVKASCAVPMVEAPPTSVPMREPMTMVVPACEPPVEKSSADETLLPDQTPMPVITSSVPASPIKCAMPSRIVFCASRNKKFSASPFPRGKGAFPLFPKAAPSPKRHKGKGGVCLPFHYTLPPLSWQLPSLRCAAPSFEKGCPSPVRRLFPLCPVKAFFPRLPAASSCGILLQKKSFFV